MTVLETQGLAARHAARALAVAGTATVSYTHLTLPTNSLV